MASHVVLCTYMSTQVQILHLLSVIPAVVLCICADPSVLLALSPFEFQTRKPRKFDFELPDISLSDLQYLKSCCPAEVQPFLR